MMLVNHYAIWPPIPKTIFIKHCRVEIIACPFVLFHNDRFFNVCCLSVSESLLHICLNSSSCHNVLILLSLSAVTNLSLLVGVCAACMLAYKCLQMIGGQPWRLLPFHRRKHCWCAHTSLLANFQCSHRVVLVPYCIIYSSHLIVVWFLQAISTGMIPAIAIISRLFCLQGTCGSFKYFPKNALLSFCRNVKSAVHVQYAGWLILPCSALARTHDFKNFLSSIKVFCCKIFTLLWYRRMPHTCSYRCLYVQSSMSSPLHHFSYRRLSVRICLQTRVSLSSCFCTSFSAAPLRIASLTLLLNVEWRSW